MKLLSLALGMLFAIQGSLTAGDAESLSANKPERYIPSYIGCLPGQAAHHLYNFNNFDANTIIPAGTPIPFNGTPVQSGKQVAQLSPTTFSVTKSGDYFVSFVGNALLPTAGSGVILNVDGATVGPGTPTAFDDTPLLLQQIVSVKIVPPAKSATLQVVVTGTQLTFPSGPSASISIIQLSKGKH